MGVAGYYLKQLEEDALDGNHSYFQTKYNLATTREQVLGLGPSLSAVTGGGLFIEAKIFFETAGVNRSVGTRPTLRLAMPLNFK